MRQRRKNVLLSENNFVMLIKVSCVRDFEQIGSLCNFGVDYLAFDFRDSSKRFFGQKNSSATSEIPRKIKRGGIFDSNSLLYVISIAGQLGLNSVQIDGDQSPQFCEKIAAEGLEIIKTFTHETIDKMSDYEGVCNKFIMRGFSVDELVKMEVKTPFFIECGLTDFEAIVKIENMPETLVGFDTGIGFENAVAVKNMRDIEKLIQLKR